MHYCRRPCSKFFSKRFFSLFPPPCFFFPSASISFALLLTRCSHPSPPQVTFVLSPHLQSLCLQDVSQQERVLLLLLFLYFSISIPSTNPHSEHPVPPSINSPRISLTPLPPHSRPPLRCPFHFAPPLGKSLFSAYRVFY